MDMRTLKRLGWMTASLSLTTLFAGCQGEDLAGDETQSESAAFETTNGFTGINGLSGINGLTGFNGLSGFNGNANSNGLSLLYGLRTSSGLSSNTGLMTSPMGRRAVKYVASCALGSGQTLTKADNYGKNHSFGGSMNLAPGWLDGTPSPSEEGNVSACVLARMNTAGMHVPLWMDSGASQIGWGQNSAYPVQEAAYFGNVMRANSDGTVHAWYCEGRNYKNGIVPGRLGAIDSTGIYKNPWGKGALCDDHCVKYGSDGYSSCNGVANPITVWRQASYNPVFDDDYIYKLVNVSSHLALDVAGNSTSENAAVDQWYENGASNQQFRIIQVATSQWKIVNVTSGKAVTDRNGSSANMMMNSYNGSSTDNWAIDDHNGHFIIRNKATNAYLRAPSGSAGAPVSVTTSYSGAADTDWDLTAVNSL